jgi:hypothetical protein
MNQVWAPDIIRKSENGWDNSDDESEVSLGDPLADGENGHPMS